MDILQNRPESYRLNFADFGEVCETSLRSGIVTDIKVQDALTPWAYPCSAPPYNYYGTSGTPSTLVLSKAKVDIGGDYLPLFFHPRTQCWDEEDSSGAVVVPATDFNQEGKYFEKAWQSFRVGDPVAVMLQKGVPVAIMGFADGNPRLGEDWIKVAGPWFDSVAQQMGATLWYWQCSNAKIGPRDTAIYDPLGRDLRLNLAFGPSKIQQDWEPQPQQPGWVDYQSNWHPDTDFYGNPLANPWAANGNGWEYNVLANVGPQTSPPAPYPGMWYTHTHYYVDSANITVEFMFPVGAILYIWQITYSISTNKSSVVYLTADEAADLIPGALVHAYGTEYWDGDAYYMTPGAVGSETPETSLASNSPQIGAGVYSEELRNEVLGSEIKNPVNQYPGIYSQFTSFNMDAQPDWQGFQMDWQNVQIFVRPHTKEELQAAGMWPVAAGA